TGCRQYIVARPKLYVLILKHVPVYKTNFGDRMLYVIQDDNNVIVHLLNKDTLADDILVSANSAYSAVRQCMYKSLKRQG
ncbi:hypothetical protein BGZ95_003970, partial [Linnemannia exigua]